ncbi:MAG: hypothetical protein LBK95_04615 [Bifidobacteriaceae bacterium]|jgi:hypothetical protein|nr:hypothetical protein [Bifidobacteriaceae bacterium]
MDTRLPAAGDKPEDVAGVGKAAGRAGGPEQKTGDLGHSDDSERRPDPGFRFLYLLVGVPAILVAGLLVVLLVAYSSFVTSGRAVELTLILGVLFVVFNLPIAQLTPVWVIVVYAVAASTAVNLPLFSLLVRHGGAGTVVWSWALGIVGLAGTALGMRSFHAPGAKSRKGQPDPLPPTSTDE